LKTQHEITVLIVNRDGVGLFKELNNICKCKQKQEKNLCICYCFEGFLLEFY